MEGKVERTLKTNEILKNAGLGIFSILLTNLIIYSIGDVFAVFDNAINPIKSKPISLEDVIGDTLGYLSIGTVVMVAIAAGLISMAQPFVMEDPELIAIVFLETMHVVSTLIFVYFMAFRLKSY